MNTDEILETGKEYEAVIQMLESVKCGLAEAPAEKKITNMDYAKNPLESCSRDEIEKHILGLLLLDHGLFSELENIISEIDFFKSRHAAIFRAMKEIKTYSSNKFFDCLAIIESLSGNEFFENDEEIKRYIKNLMIAAPRGALIIVYAKRLREMAV